MVKIRLTRIGRKHHAQYRLAVMNSTSARDSKAIEYVGHYFPHEKETKLETERIQYWLSVGAQPSDTVKRILIKNNVLKEDKTKKTYSKKPGKQSVERAEKKAEKLNAPKEEAKAETPAEEVAAE